MMETDSKLDLKQDFRRRLFPASRLAIGILAFGLFAFANTVVASTDLGNATIKLVDGTTLEGTITAIDQAGNLSGEGIDSINLQEVLSITTTRKTEPDPASDISVVLSNGGWIMASRPLMEEDKIKFQSASGVRELPLESARAIVWTTSDFVQSSIKSPSKDNDRVIAKSKGGEVVIEGVLAVSYTHLTLPTILLV